MRIPTIGLAALTAIAAMGLGNLARANVLAAQPDSTVSATPNAGRELYLRVGCYQCHGRVGQGGLAGPPLAGSTLPYPAFAEVTRNPRWNMPPYSQKSLSDEELHRIYEYVIALSR